MLASKPFAPDIKFINLQNRIKKEKVTFLSYNFGKNRVLLGGLVGKIG